MTNQVEKATQETTQYSKDAWITSQVKAKLMNQDGLHDSNIHVETKKGEVYLTGQVFDEHQKRLAIQAAQSVQDGQNVNAEHLTVSQQDAQRF